MSSTRGRSPRTTRLGLLLCCCTLLLASLAAAQRGPYPSYDGSNNNLEHPEWGAAGQPFLRTPISKMDYAGLKQMGGTRRRSARFVSLAFSTPVDRLVKERNYLTNTTDMLSYLGQYFSHDMTARSTLKNDTAPIDIPKGDPFLDWTGTGNKTMPFERTAYKRDAEENRQPINKVTAFIDGSIIYGLDNEANSKLRTLKDGLMRDDGLGNLPYNQDPVDPTLPMFSDIPVRGLPATMYRAAGELTVNQNPGLLVMASLFLREHNRRAKLRAANTTGGSDEELFQYARKWTVAQLQHLAYTEYLINLGIFLPAYTGYDPSANPGMDVFFETVSWRYGHAVVTDQILRLGEDGLEHPDGHLTLLESYYRPDVTLTSGIEPVLRGMSAKVQGQVSPSFVTAIQHHLFGYAGVNGTDLVARNIQRARDHGIPDYNTCRAMFKLPAAKTFADVSSDPEVQAALKAAFGTVDDMDPYVAGLAEDHLKGKHFGPLFYASMMEQFYRVRAGDWWHFENTANGLFTADEIDEIRNRGLRNLILDNTNITLLPANVFMLDQGSLWRRSSTCAAGGSLSALSSNGTSSTQTIPLLGGKYQLSMNKTTHDGKDWLHVLVVAEGMGWVGFGVAADHFSRMRGADIIIARMVNGAPAIDDYMADDFQAPTPDTAFPPATSDVKLINFVQDAVQGTTTVEFERPLTASDGRDLAIPSTGDVTLIFAFSEDSNDLVHHSFNRGYQTFTDIFVGNLTAQANGTSLSLQQQDVRVAHAILMTINFLVILPLGALTARYLRSHWIKSNSVLATMFYVHIICQIGGVAVATAGFVLAINQFHKPYDSIMLSHGSLGVAVVSGLYIQLLVGFFRPPITLGSHWRRIWEVLHIMLGRITIFLGLVNCSIGVYIYNFLYGKDVTPWVSCFAVGLGSVLLLQTALDRHEKHQVYKIQQSGALHSSESEEDDQVLEGKAHGLGSLGPELEPSTSGSSGQSGSSLRGPAGGPAYLGEEPLHAGRKGDPEQGSHALF